MMGGWFIELTRRYFCIEKRFTSEKMAMDSNASYIATIIHIM